MKRELCRIISNDGVKAGYFLMEIESPSIAREALPGQFLTLRCGNSTTPLLRRPFGFHRIKKWSFQVLYEVVGEGTRALSVMKEGSFIDALGPLGRGFPLPNKSANIILVAGGIGVAPLMALAEAANRKSLVLIGARTKDDVLCEREFKRLGCEVKISTDDGSRGAKGLVTGLLKNCLSSIVYGLSSIYACGPNGMLKGVGLIAKDNGIRAYASLQENVACGIGVCLGCAVKTISGYKLACKDGPVFDLNEVVFS